MRTRPLGRTGLNVGAAGLGAMPLSLSGRPPEDRGVEVIHAALDAGMTLVDTADVYCLDHRDIGHNERLIARALREWTAPSTAVVVATKGGLERPGGAWTTNGRPEHLRRACEASLKALGVDAITLYQLHAPDADVPFEDSVGALVRLQEEGKIVHIGLSNVTVDLIERARALVDVVSVQNRCNPFDQTSILNGVVDYCAREDIAFLPYSPVGGHFGHARTGEDPTLGTIAERHGATPWEVCIAWLLAVSPVMIPIPGASRVASALSSAGAVEIELSPTELEEVGKRRGEGAR